MPESAPAASSPVAPPTQGTRESGPPAAAPPAPPPHPAVPLRAKELIEGKQPPPDVGGLKVPPPKGDAETDDLIGRIGKELRSRERARRAEEERKEGEAIVRDQGKRVDEAKRKLGEANRKVEDAERAWRRAQEGLLRLKDQVGGVVWHLRQHVDREFEVGRRYGPDSRQAEDALNMRLALENDFRRLREEQDHAIITEKLTSFDLRLALGKQFEAEEDYQSKRDSLKHVSDLFGTDTANPAKSTPAPRPPARP